MILSIRRNIFIILVFLCMMLPAGCGNDDQNREADKMKVELNQRQKELLEKMGLPTEYDKLTYSQKNAVVSIEEMLVYLEKTYHEAFSYLSYTAPGVLEKEHLEAYPVSGSPADVVTVYRTYEDGEYTYEDDYRSLQAASLYESAVKSFVRKSFPEAATKVFCDVRSTSGEVSAGEVTEQNVMRSVSAATCIFISADACTEEQFETFAQESARWLGENSSGVPAQIWLRLTVPSEWDEIQRSMYEDKLTEDIFISEKECAVSASGQISVY